MNAFAWIKSFTIVLIILLADFTTLKGTKTNPIFAKNRYLFGLDMGKINICGDKMEAGCHLKIVVFFQFLKDMNFRRILAFYNSLKWGYLFVFLRSFIKNVANSKSMDFSLDDKVGNIVEIIVVKLMLT